MIEYLKMIIVAIFTGLTAPLPVSSSAHFNFLFNVLGLEGDGQQLSFYYNAFLLILSLIIMISYRKIFIGGIKSLFVSKEKQELYSSLKGYRIIEKNILVSLISTLILFVPISKEKLLMDYFDSFLNLNSVILSGFACIISACMLLIAIWYTRKRGTQINKTTNTKTALRLSLYQLPCYIIPGFSHIAGGCVNLILCDVKIKTFLSELYVYLAPSMFIVSLVKVIRSVASGVLINPVLLLIGIVFFALAAKLMLNLTTKVNLRRLFAVFSVYSLLFGAFIAVAAFLI